MPDSTRLSAWPVEADVLVVGAGPAGSACAKVLAEAGLRVLLADQHAFPRDKICGDGLIPDAHAALKRLGLYDAVMAEAVVPNMVSCIGPRGGRVNVPGPLAVLPRKRLDHLLLQGAQRAGATLLPPARFLAPLHNEAGVVVGAKLRSAAAPSQAEAEEAREPVPQHAPRHATESAAEQSHDRRQEQDHELRCRWLVLATGAMPQAMLAAGLCERKTPNGIALRGYVAHPGMGDEIRSLELIWHPKLKGGYGWVFPAPGGQFNIGVGVVDSHRSANSRSGKAGMVDINLREMFATFCEAYPPAGRLMREGRVVGELKGAPLRCTLQGARYSGPGLLATGEAIGSTYSFTGEGIGKALETGLLAADAIVAGVAQGLPEAQVRAAYEAQLALLKPRFALYTKANRVNHHPWLADLVIWRANKSPRVLRKLQAVLNETVNPGRMFTALGLLKMFWPSR